MLEKDSIDEEAAAAALEQAKTALDRARRQLEGWNAKEVPFARRGEEISRKWEDAGIDDQKDELSELQKMYGADELVDATEEVVLKRSKRRLAITEESRTLSTDRRQHRVDLEERVQTETREENVRMQAGALARLERSQAIERRSRADARARSADELFQKERRLERLKGDRERFTVHAPRAGILLHGREKDYRPGRTPARHERGSQLQARADLFLVADPDSQAVAIEVPESMLKDCLGAIEVAVQPLAAPETSASGRLALEPQPAAKAGDEAVFEGLVRMEKPIPGARFGMRAKVKLPAAKASG